MRAPVKLGVDCTEPVTVSLPDDVLTECEGELTERRSCRRSI